MNIKSKKMPNPVIKRFSKYLAHIQDLTKKNLKWTSSRKLAINLGLTSVTVRQDLRYLDFNGVGRRGYLTKGLRNTLTTLFETNIEKRVALVGAGNLGQALIKYIESQKSGFNICGIFDSNPKKIGIETCGLGIQHTDELPETIIKNNIQFGIIAVPAKSAQQVADQLILSGIKGLLNLSPICIRAPKRVPVVEQRILNSLHELVLSVKQKCINN